MERSPWVPGLSILVPSLLWGEGQGEGEPQAPGQWPAPSPEPSPRGGEGVQDRRGERHPAGFTLIELLAVLALVALIAGGVVHAVWPGRHAAELRTTSEAIATYLKAARTRAIETGLDVAVLFDVERHLVYRPDNAVRSSRPLAIGSQITLQATTAEQESQVPGMAGIRFFSNGSSTGGKLRLSLGRASYEINVNWLTGRVTVHAAT